MDQEKPSTSKLNTIKADKQAHVHKENIRLDFYCDLRLGPYYEAESDSSLKTHKACFRQY